MSEELISILIFDFFIVIIPLLLYLYPAKNIGMYGYRTKRSTMNIRNWRLSQKIFAKKMIVVPVLVIISQLTLFISNIDLKQEPPLIPLISLAQFFIGSISCCIMTELKLKALNKNVQPSKKLDINLTERSQ